MANSRPWKLTAKAPVGQVHTADDHVTTRVDIPPILTQERTGQILSGVLTRRGFDEQEDGTLVREREGVTTTVDPSNGEVTVAAEDSGDLPDMPPSGGCGCQARAREMAEQAIRNAKDDVQRRVTERVAGALSKLGCELEGVSAEVTRQALKEKAAQMGEIKELTEDPKSGALTIKVEV